MRQQMDQLQKKIDDLSEQAGGPAGAPATNGSGPAHRPAPASPNSRSSSKASTARWTYRSTMPPKASVVSWPTRFRTRRRSRTGYVNNGPKGTQITGSVGWIGDLSTNKSVLGYRGSHKIDGSDIGFIYQIETQPAITSSPGLNTSYTQQSDITKAGIGYGDTFVGLSENNWGNSRSARRTRRTRSPRIA